jgi:bacterioferritin (cytochrome b1)
MTHQALQEDNKTGVETNRDGAREMREAAAKFPPTSTGSTVADDTLRIEYARDVDADELAYGSLPAPAGFAGKARVLIAGLFGGQPLRMLDKLGERLAFERTGMRMYETLISKHEAFGEFDGGPSRSELMTMLNEEHEHFELLEDVILQLDGDPTAMTPSADLALTVGAGVLTVITDPRTTLRQGLEAVLVAELADREGWSLLIELARSAGNTEMLELFEQAERTEEQHVAALRRWLASPL